MLLWENQGKDTDNAERNQHIYEEWPREKIDRGFDPLLIQSSVSNNQW